MREKILFFVLAASMLPFAQIVQAQQLKKIPRVGWIAYDGSGPPPAFITGLRERGYVPGQSIIIEYRSAQGRYERLSEIAAELVRLKPDVIVASGNVATEAAKKATTTIPIVFEHGDPVWDGIVGTLAQPGNNLTGVSSVSFELAGKRLELLRETFPKITRVGVLLDAGGPTHRRQFADMENVAQSLGVQLQALQYRNSWASLDSIFQRAISGRDNALLVLQNPALFRHRTPLLSFAAKNRLPVIYPDPAYVYAGGLMSYGRNFRDVWRRLAYYVDRILKGAKPSDLPVEQPTKFELVVNLNAAKQIGLTIPPKVLMWADRVIE